MIIGATPDTDFQILRLTQSLYRKYALKRVFFSAYMPVQSDSLLPSIDTKPPLLREHRLYQIRFQSHEASELLDETHQSFNPLIDPKCNWALNHMEQFPVEVNTAPYELLLRSQQGEREKPVSAAGGTAAGGTQSPMDGGSRNERR